MTIHTRQPPSPPPRRRPAGGSDRRRRRDRREARTPLGGVVTGAAILAAIIALLSLPERDRAASMASAIPALLAAPGIPQLSRLPPTTFAIDTPLRAAINPGRSPGPFLAAARVTVAPDRGSIAVPRSFLGLSVEYWSLAQFESRLPAFERIIALVRAPSDGPEILRIGGDSADHTYWNVRTRRSPFREFQLRPNWLQRTSQLVRRDSVRLILDLNVAAELPSMAAAWARNSLAQLPRHSVVAFEIGNEPDLYHRQLLYRLATIARGPLRSLATWRGYGFTRYNRSFGAYAQAITRAAPGIPLAGPAVANPSVDLRWISELVRTHRSQVGVLSAHRYPLAACRIPASPMYPTIARVLSNSSSTGLANSMWAAITIAHHAGVPFWLTEFNSVTCGGLDGVSDAFATALWAPDALFGLLRAGVDRVNLHVRANGVNAPFVFDRGGIQARPLLYGLVAFAQTLGRGARLLNSEVHAAQSLNLKVWAVRIRDGVLHVLIIDKGRRGALVALRLPAAGPATLRTLLAPGPASTSGVTLGGQRLDPGGNWAGRPRTDTIIGRAGHYQVALPGYSAALLTVRLSRPPAPDRRLSHRHTAARSRHR